MSIKVAMIAGQVSIHTVRWANALSARGINIDLITQDSACAPLNPEVRVHQLPFRGNAGYYLNSWRSRKLIKEIRPDIVHAHYASGYGTLARLTGGRPLFLSVWGSDVYDFPASASWKRRLIEKNLAAADWIGSTSYCMAKQTRTLLKKDVPISITPFGVDTDTFYRRPVTQDQSVVTIGTVKKLHSKYGIDTLIQGFAICRDLLKKEGEHLRLRIVGDGPAKKEYERLARNLGLGNSAEFVGVVPHHRVPDELSRLDVYCALSRLDSESFGVAVIEASACERPVIVSDAGGLPEVVQDGVTGLIIPRENPMACARALMTLVRDKSLRNQMGVAGRRFVQERYEWSDNVSLMIDNYRQFLDQCGRDRKSGAVERKAA